MAESQILSLFATPGQVRQAEMQRVREQSQMYADPIAQQLYQSGAGLASGVGSLFGAESSAMGRARQQEDIAKNIPSEFGTSQYYRDLAEQFRQRGMLQSAVVAADKAKQLDDEAQKAAQAKYGTISFAQYGSKAVPIRRLITQLERTTDPAARATLQAELEQAFKDGAAETAKREAQEAGDIAQAEESVKETAQARKDIQAKFEEANSAASSVLRITNNIQRALDAGTIFTGPTAKVEANLYAIGERLGLTSAQTQDMVANTQLAESIIGQSMLEQIKTLGTNPSNADREFLMKTLPTVLNTPGGMRKIIEFMRLKAESARADARARKEYFEKNNGSLFGYESSAFAKLEELYEREGVTGSTEPVDDPEDTTFTVEPAPSTGAPVPDQATPTPEEQSVPAEERVPAPAVTEEIAEAPPPSASQLSALTDAIVKRTFATQFGADQRLANITPFQRIQIAQRYLIAKSRSAEGLTAAESKLLDYLEQQLVQQAGPNR